MEILRVRLHIWIGVVCVLMPTILLLINPSTQTLPAIPARLTPPGNAVQPFRASIHQGAPKAESLDENSAEFAGDFLRWPKSVLGTGSSEAALVAELISDLRSSDRNIRIAAATKLSWHSTFAREALPALSLLIDDDPDDQVRERIQEAILNVRGYDRGLF